MKSGRELSSPLKKLEQVIRRAIVSIDPNFGKFDRPIYGKILKVTTKGGKVDESAKGFSADIQPLKKDLTADPDFEKIQDVPLNVLSFGNGGAVYAVPKVGAIVRVGFMYNDPSFPYIIAVTNEGMTIPEGSVDEFRVETSEGVILQLNAKKVNFKTEGFNSDLETLIQKFLEHTHLGNMGAPTSPVSGTIPPITPADFNTGSL